MKSLLIGMALGCALAGQAQSACKYEMNKVDKYTKTKVVITKANISIYSAGGDAIGFRAVDSLYFLDLYFTCPNDAAGIMEGASLKLLMADSTVIEVKATSTTIARVQRAGNYLIQTLDPTYLITREQLEVLASVAVVEMRLHFAQSMDDRPMAKPQRQEKIKRAAKCLLEAT